MNHADQRRRSLCDLLEANGLPYRPASVGSAPVSISPRFT
jgi:hypothetical protein